MTNIVKYKHLLLLQFMLVGLVTKTSCTLPIPNNPLKCAPVELGLVFCKPYLILGGLQTGPLARQCCTGVNKIKQAVSNLGSTVACNCVRKFLTPFIFKNTFTTQMQNAACGGVSLGFDIGANPNCNIPSPPSPPPPGSIIPPPPSPSPKGSPIISPTPSRSPIIPPTLSPSPLSGPIIPPTPSPSPTNGPIISSPSPISSPIIPPTPSPSPISGPIIPPTPSPSPTSGPVVSPTPSPSS